MPYNPDKSVIQLGSDIRKKLKILKGELDVSTYEEVIRRLVDIPWLWYGYNNEKDEWFILWGNIHMFNDDLLKAINISKIYSFHNPILLNGEGLINLKFCINNNELLSSNNTIINNSDFSLSPNNISICLTSNIIKSMLINERSKKEINNDFHILTNDEYNDYMIYKNNIKNNNR